MSSISFDNPYLLFLIIPVAALFIVPFAIVIRKDNVNGHNIASGIIHVILAAIIGFVAAGTSIITTVTETDVYVLADVSYSASKNFDSVDRYIADLKKNLPDNSRLGIICFANGYKMITRMGGNVVSVKEALSESAGSGAIDDSATDIIGALNYVCGGDEKEGEISYGLFKKDVIKRIVLITDGLNTKGTGALELKSKINSLVNDRGIYVDAIFIDGGLKEGEEEGQLCSADFVQNVYKGNDERANIAIRCNFAQSGEEGRTVAASIKITRKTYSSSGELTDSYEYEEPLSLVRGNNAYTVKLSTDKVGRVEYEAQLKFPADGAFADGNAENNFMAFTQYVEERGEALLITQSEEDYVQLKALYGDRLKDENCYINNPRVPCTVEELCAFDQIILADVDLNFLENTVSFADSLCAAVSSFGKGLITVGDLHLQNTDSRALRNVADMLPVKYNLNDGGRLVTLVIDASHSMMLNNKLIHAKRAARAIVNILDDGDDVQIITFDGEARPGIKRTLGRSYNVESEAGATVNKTGRQIILEDIQKIATEHGTVMEAGLESAYDSLSSTVYSDKRVMILSDGTNFGGLYASDRFTDVYDIAIKLRAMDVLTAAFSVADGTDPTGKATLDRVASFGGTEKAYDILSAESLSQVINNDLLQIVDPSDGGRSRINVKRTSDDVLKGISAQLVGTTEVYNYVAGRNKATATTVLTVNNGRTGGEAPLYAYWTYGTGKVASFASKLEGDWMLYWKAYKNEILAPFFTNVLEGTAPEERIVHPFTVKTTDCGGYMQVTVTPYRLRSGVQAKLIYSSPDGSVHTLRMDAGASSYVANLPFTEGFGKYSFNVEYGGVLYDADYCFVTSYSAEYDRFALCDEGMLYSALGANGTVATSGDIKLENDKSDIQYKYFSLTLPLLISAVVLFAVDIAVRKLKKEDLASFFKRVKK